MRQDEKWIFIVNPVAGNGFAQSFAEELRKKIQQYEVDADIVFTERRGHATVISDKYANMGYSFIIGVGGDGTFNEIAAPLIHKKDISVGLVPAGTGNDFIQILGFPGRFSEHDWQVFFQKNTIRMDVGKCNNMIFLNGMGLGFDAQVAAENYTEPGKVKPGGKSKYIWHILKTLLFFKEKRMTVISNDIKSETDCFINTVAIGRRFAGSFFLTPQAVANDGLLDVCSIKKLSLPQRLRILLRVPKGTHIFDRKVNYYQTDHLSLEFPGDVPYHVDGELYFSKNFDIGIMPEALNIIYNPSGPHFFKRN
jgi:YegS/Rv2252/BmrU family lipid kinase